jgi:hypothetical protein
MDDQGTNREGSGITARRLTVWFTCLSGVVAFCAFAHIFIATDDMAGPMFSPMLIFLATLALAFCVYAACFVAVSLEDQKPNRAQPIWLATAVVAMYGIWLYVVIALHRFEL